MITKPHTTSKPSSFAQVRRLLANKYLINDTRIVRTHEEVYDSSYVFFRSHLGTGVL